ncbi:ribbon-helix-helix domain-containing protein [Spirochaeta dissipatitropha]
MTTVRLPADMEKKLSSISKAQKKSKSEIIKDALEMFMEQEHLNYCSYELGEDLFGQYGSGRNDLSKNYKHILKDKLNDKFHTH